MDEAISTKIRSLKVNDLSAVEISGNRLQDLRWASYEALAYPDFDLTEPPVDLPGPFDVVICEQVLEHVVDPATAVGTLYALTRPGGMVIVNTPFMVRVHDSPIDYWRFTPEALRFLLQQAGFKIESVDCWGNRVAVIVNLYGWMPAYRVLPMRANPDFPVVVWAFATRPVDREG
jgi:hypothetical protein